MPTLPEGADYLWHLYLDLHNATKGEITYSELQAYTTFNGDLTAFEVEAVRTLNQLFMRIHND